MLSVFRRGRGWLTRAGQIIKDIFFIVRLLRASQGLTRVKMLRACANAIAFVRTMAIEKS